MKYFDDLKYDTEINKIAAKLAKGETILYPTDTIWGLGCDATNPIAVEKIFTIKKRPTNKPLLLLVDSITMLKEYVEEVHPRIETLLHLHQQPLTLVYSKGRNLPKISMATDQSLAIRICNFEFTKRIITTFGKPIISTSANHSNQPSPKHFDEITDDIKNQVDYIVGEFRDQVQSETPSVIAMIAKDGNLEFIR